VIAYERTPTGTLLIRTTVAVGVEDLDVALDVGTWAAEREDPAGPLGLASTPVIVLPDARWTDLATAGALRAGRRPACLRLPADAPGLGIQLLVAVTEGADVVLIEDGAAPALDLARTLGGRPLAVLPLGDPAEVDRYLSGARFDTHVPVPSVDDPLRARIADAIAPLALEDRHHLVEVDPYPGFAEARIDPSAAPLEAFSAAAAGVLAGRLAASNRRWRRQAGI
jgi:hypothetical protein